MNNLINQTDFFLIPYVNSVATRSSTTSTRGGGRSGGRGGRNNNNSISDNFQPHQPDSTTEEASSSSGNTFAFVGGPREKYIIPNDIFDVGKEHTKLDKTKCAIAFVYCVSKAAQLEDSQQESILQDAFDFLITECSGAIGTFKKITDPTQTYAGNPYLIVIFPYCYGWSSLAKKAYHLMKEKVIGIHRVNFDTIAAAERCWLRDLRQNHKLGTVDCIPNYHQWKWSQIVQENQESEKERKEIMENNQKRRRRQTV